MEAMYAENAQLQLDELDRIRACLVKGEELSMVTTESDLQALRGVATSAKREGEEGESRPVDTGTIPKYTLVFAVKLPIGGSGASDGEGVITTIKVVLPKQYPQSSKTGARFLLEAEGYPADSERAQSFTQALRAFVASFAGSREGCVTPAIEFVRENGDDLWGLSGAPEEGAKQRAEKDRRVFLLFHHMLYGKEHKKEAKVVALAKSLGVSGFIQYGKPSVVGIEGTAQQIEDFCRGSKAAGKQGEVTKDVELKEGEGPCFNNGKAGLQAIHALGKQGETPDVHALTTVLQTVGLEGDRKAIQGRG